MTASLIAWALFAHFVGDFPLQSDAMAKGKSSSFRWLALHALTYSITVALMLSLVMDPLTAHMIAFGNGAAHFVIDAVTSRLSKRQFDLGNIHNAFTVIGFDQFLHASILLASLSIGTQA